MRIDIHSDILHKMHRLGISDPNDDQLKSSIPKLQEGGVSAVVSVMFMPQTNYNYYPDMLRHFEYLMRSAIELKPKLNAAGIKMILALENAEVISHEDMVEPLHRAGVRYISLCHKMSNHLCRSSDQVSYDYNYLNGITEQGKKTLREMNRLGIIPDVSHANEEATSQIIARSTKPVIASHSNCCAIHNDPRNLTDENMRLIKSSHGMVGFTTLKRCIGPYPTIGKLVDHILHGIEIMGIDHVGFGSDFDGGGGFRGLEDASKLDALDRALRVAGLTDSDLEKFWGLNFLRVFNENNTTTAS